MKFDPPLVKATLLRRYKRFLADVVFMNGEHGTVHCPNTGSMKNCVVENSTCYLYDANNPRRKYRYSWELATVPGGFLAGINTHRANSLVVDAINATRIPELAGYSLLQREQKYGSEGSRIDILLQNDDQRCFVEVKSVTLADTDRCGYFPDAKSDRACKHLRELMGVVEQGDRGVLCFCVQHTGIDSVAPADEIDPRYGRLLRQAVSVGVEVIAYQVQITPSELELSGALPVLL